MKRQYETERAIQKKIKENRGQIVGKGYRPWYLTKELSSNLSYKVRCQGADNRTYHLASRLELYVYLMLEKHKSVIAIYEQFYIPRELTLSISDQIGIKHPGYKVHVAQVMTLDFFCQVNHQEENRKIGISVIPDKDMTRIREYEHWEIVALACEHLGYEFYLIPEMVMDKDIIRGMEWGFTKKGWGNDVWAASNIEEAKNNVLSIIQTKSYNKLTINQLSTQLDHEYLCEEGTYLSVIRYMLAERLIDYDYFSAPLSEQTLVGKLVVTLNDV